MLVALALLLSACTIDVFTDDESDHSHEPGTGEHDHGDEETDDESDHSHEPGTGEHDHGDEEAAGVDHHGNPIFSEDERVYEVATADGVEVEFTVENFIGVGGRGGEVAPRLVEGQHANLQFHVTDSATEQPLGGLNPAVWVDFAANEAECSDRVQGYLTGMLDRRAAINLNSYFILTMNQDSTISVIDPMVDVAGMTNLFSVIILQAPAQDWVMAPQQSRLFATLPDLDKVAVVDLNAFLVEDTVDLPGKPQRIALAPDGASVWVTLGDDGGVAVIDAATLDVATIGTDGATGAIAFAAGGTRAIVGTATGVVVVDVAGRRVVGSVPLGGAAGAVANSPGSGTVYVTIPGAGAIAILDPERGLETARLPVEEGITDIGVSPDGAWAVAVNPDAEKAYLLQTAHNRITHQVPVPGVPDRVTFTGAAAYIHTSGSPAMTAIPLEEIDPAGDVSVLTIPIGERPAGAAGTTVTADAITATPDGEALLIANPADDQVYFYTEGSQAALGGFQGHTLIPRAVQVVDRSLKEPSPGVYTGSIRIPAGGDYVVAFLLDSPQLTHCFSFTARAADDAPAETDTVIARVEMAPEQELTTGESNELEFSVRESVTGDLIAGVEDVVAMLIHAGGSWSSRVLASAQPDGGYVAEFTPPESGTYTVLFAIPSLGMTFQSIPPMSVRVSAP
jgi:DNA-binding beta-propeller fold protein YncE